MMSVLIDMGIAKGLMHSWIHNYEEFRYNDFIESNEKLPTFYELIKGWQYQFIKGT